MSWGVFWSCSKVCSGHWQTRSNFESMRADKASLYWSYFALSPFSLEVNKTYKQFIHITDLFQLQRDMGWCKQNFAVLFSWLNDQWWWIIHHHWSFIQLLYTPYQSIGHWNYTHLIRSTHILLVRESKRGDDSCSTLQVPCLSLLFYSKSEFMHCVRSNSQNLFVSTLDAD